MALVVIFLFEGPSMNRTDVGHNFVNALERHLVILQIIGYRIGE